MRIKFNMATKQDKLNLSKALNTVLGTDGVTFEQMSMANMQKVWDALMKINHKIEIDNSHIINNKTPK